MENQESRPINPTSNHVHTSETHQNVLKNLCRLCCCKAKKWRETGSNKNKRDRTVLQSSSKIKTVFGIDVGQDIPDVHPKLICTSCFHVLQKDTSSERYNSIKNHVEKINHLWIDCEFRDSTQLADCNLCMINDYFASGKRGQTKNFKPWDLPDHLTINKASQMGVNDIDSRRMNVTKDPISSLPASHGTSSQTLLSATAPNHVPPSPTWSMCTPGSTFFRGLPVLGPITPPRARNLNQASPMWSMCTPRLFHRGSPDHSPITPPRARAPSHVAPMWSTCSPRPPSAMGSPGLSRITPPRARAPNNDAPTWSICTPGPPSAMRSPDPNPITHTESPHQCVPKKKSKSSVQCEIDENLLPIYKEKVLRDIINMPDDANPSQLVQKAAGKVTKVLSNKSQDGSVSYPTGGTPYTVKTTQKSRKPFNSLKSPVKRRKAREMEGYRKVICGDKNKLHQLGYELKRLPLKKRIQVVEIAGIKQGAHITKELGLALKCRVGLSWAQRDKLQSILKTIGVTQENKNAQRDQKT